MRGKGRVRHAVHRFVGITPACAGKRCQLVHAYDDGWDHPRVCGEKSSRGRVDLLRLGLPPRMRGKVLFRSFIVQPFGITPAYAGKRFDQRRQFVESEDHPRMCGEKLRMCRRTVARLGSPPHVRGKDRCTVSAAYHAGITPACAGKSGSLRFSTARCRDHPRMCGEKLTWYNEQGDYVRITPACAGKSVQLSEHQCRSWDHPRRCGEKTKKIP